MDRQNTAPTGVKLLNSRGLLGELVEAQPVDIVTTIKWSRPRRVSNNYPQNTKFKNRF